MLGEQLDITITERRSINSNKVTEIFLSSKNPTLCVVPNEVRASTMIRGVESMDFVIVLVVCDGGVHVGVEFGPISFRRAIDSAARLHEQHALDVVTDS